MHEEETNINDEILDIKKKILNEKEEDIMVSQVIQNRLEDKIRKLKQKKENIIKGNKWLTGDIIYTIIYDTLMETLLILFVMYFISKFNLITSLYKKTYVIGISLGVVAISVIGAYISSNIREKLRCYYNKKRVVKISKHIRENEIILGNEIDKQENIKKEITNIMNGLDSDLETKIIDLKQDETYYNHENIFNGYNEINVKSIKKRIRK